MGCGRRGLGGADCVVDLPKPANLDGKRVAVLDRSAEQVLVLQGAEEPRDDPVGLRGPDAGADTAQQRVLAGERFGEHTAAEAGPAVSDHCDRCRDGAQQFAGGLLDQVDLATIDAQVVERSSRSACWTAAVRQARASGPRAVGVRVVARQYLVAQSITAQMRQIPPAVSNSEKSVCQTRLLRWVVAAAMPTSAMGRAAAPMAAATANESRPSGIT